MILTPCTPDEAATHVLGLGEDLRLAYMELTTSPGGYPTLDAHPKCKAQFSNAYSACNPTCEKQP